jgi:hypothetical protein
VIVLDPRGGIGVAHNTPYIAFAAAGPQTLFGIRSPFSS